MKIPELTEPRFQKLALRLARIGRSRPEVGQTDIDLVLENLIGRSLLCLPLLAQNRPLVDIGAGVGIPGLVLALARPELPVILLEPRSSCHGIIRWLLKELPPLEQLKLVEAKLRDFDFEDFPPLQATSRAALDWPELNKYLPENCGPVIRWSSPELTPAGSFDPKYLLKITVTHFNIRQVFTWLGDQEMFHVKQKEWQSNPNIEINPDPGKADFMDSAD